MSEPKDPADRTRAVELLWQRFERTPGAAPRRVLTLDAIVAAGIELADGEGLAALSMSRLAQRLDCAPMSLYRHVANKDELLVFMVDAAVGPLPSAEGPSSDWRAGLERWARELRAIYFAHPWVLEIPVRNPPIEPGQLAWLDRGLQYLGATRLAAADKVGVIMMLLHYVRGEAQLSMSRSSGPHADERELLSWYGGMLRKLVDPARFPALYALIAEGAFEPSAASARRDEFDFGLARALDGIESLVRASDG